MQRSFTFAHDDFLPAIRARLLAILGPQCNPQPLDPLSQLVKVSISTQTRDQISDRAFDRLRKRYPSWELRARDAPSAIEAVIRPVAHADRKAVTLPAALRMIVARNGRLDLEFLADWEDEAAMQWLDGLPGVGAKVAATVLNFSTLHRRVLPVDTHLLQLGERLGLLPAKSTYESGFDIFMRRLPADWDADTLFELHWLLKYLGQMVCTKKSPDCSRCPLRDLCPRLIADDRDAGSRGRTGQMAYS
jgi:endonuclease III